MDLLLLAIVSFFFGQMLFTLTRQRALAAQALAANAATAAAADAGDLLRFKPHVGARVASVRWDGSDLRVEIDRPNAPVAILLTGAENRRGAPDLTGSVIRRFGQAVGGVTCTFETATDFEVVHAAGIRYAAGL